MVVEEDMKQGEFVCPHCTGNSLCLSVCKGKMDYSKIMNYGAVKRCHSTFAKETIEVKKTAEDETFNKRALPYYCRVNLPANETT